MSEDRLHIANLGLSKRTYRLLAHKGLRYADQLHAATDKDLLGIPAFGPVALKEVRRALRNHEDQERTHAQELPSVAVGGRARVLHMQQVEMGWPDYSGPLISIEGGYSKYDEDVAYLDPQQALALLAWLKQEEAALQRLVEKMGVK